MVRRLSIALVGLLAGTANAQEAPFVDGSRQVTGKVYSCRVDGVLHYTSTPIAGGDCRTINYNYEELAVGPGWNPLTKDKEVSAYLNDRVVRTGDKASVWVMYHFSKAVPAVSGIGQHRSYVERVDIKCKEQTLQTLQRTYYSGAVGQGQVVGEWRPLTAPLTSYAVPNSFGAATVDAACKAPNPSSKGRSP